MAKIQKKKKASGCLLVYYDLLKAICAERGESIDTVMSNTRLSHHTIERMRKGKPIRPSSLRKLSKYIGVENLDRVSRRIDAETPSLRVEDNRELAGKVVEEWRVEKSLTPWITASNGLQFQILKMRHSHLPNTWARGKCYELGYLPADSRSRLQEHLVRHSAVCRRIKKHPRIPVNERTFPHPTGERWWVIDTWSDGGYLADLLGKEPLGVPESLRIGREIAEGLKVLHDHGIIRRELSPKFVLLEEPNKSVLLTDFELAKLLGENPTVSGEWPADPYRAPEVGETDVDVRADIYSWGRIMVFATLGILPAVGKEKSPLRGSDLPETLVDLLVRCVALPRSDRPKSMDEVLGVLDSLR